MREMQQAEQAVRSCQGRCTEMTCSAGVHAYGLDISEVLVDGAACKHELHQHVPPMLPAGLAQLDNSGTRKLWHKT